MKWYGSVTNRIEEAMPSVNEIKVGTGATEYLWSDTHAYEVTKVENQKHVWIRRYDARRKENSGDYSNDWDLVSNPQNKEIEMSYRYNHWYQVKRTNCLGEQLEKPRYEKMSIRFGVAQEYFDYEF